MSVQRGFCDIDERYTALSAAGDPLQRLAAVVDFEVFRPVLDAALARSDRARGRPPYDSVVMFRVLVLQALYSLSDEQAEFQLRDRLSFMRFVGLELHDPVPDAKTIWWTVSVIGRFEVKSWSVMLSLRAGSSFCSWSVCDGHIMRSGREGPISKAASPKQR